MGRWIPWLTALAALLAIPLLLLQYRWTGELAQADRARRLAFLDQQATTFTREFDQAWGRLAFALLLGPSFTGNGPLDFAQRRAEHQGVSSDAQYVRAVWWIEMKPGGPKLSRLTEEGDREPVTEWPDRLQPLRDSAQDSWRSARIGPFALFPDSLAVIGLRGRPPGLPFGGGPGGPGERRDWPRELRRDHEARGGHLRGDRPEPPRDSGRFRREPGRPLVGQPLGFPVLELDLERLQTVLLPEIRGHAFGADPASHRVQVVNSRMEVVWDSQPDRPAFEADVVRPLFSTRPAFLGSGPRPELGTSWYVRVAVAGGIDAAVNQARARNLAVGGGVVALLAATVALLLSSLRRAQRLTEREFEFVAQATHELRTPIAVIRSAAENLADGVVRDEAQVRRYGGLVREESRRLSRLIEQVLQYGRVTRQPDTAPVAVGELVEKVFRERRDAQAPSNMRIESTIGEGLPPVLADADAVQLVLRNLIENAMVHAAAGGWIGIEARSNGRWVEVRVRDRGEPVPNEERERIFDPFYRGAKSRSEGRSGSGLGLALSRRLAEAQGGTLEWEASAEGNSFLLRLPQAK